MLHGDYDDAATMVWSQERLPGWQQVELEHAASLYGFICVGWSARDADVTNVLIPSLNASRNELWFVGPWGSKPPQGVIQALAAAGFPDNWINMSFDSFAGELYLDLDGAASQVASRDNQKLEFRRLQGLAYRVVASGSSWPQGAGPSYPGRWNPPGAPVIYLSLDPQAARYEATTQLVGSMFVASFPELMEVVTVRVDVPNVLDLQVRANWRILTGLGSSLESVIGSDWAASQAIAARARDAGASGLIVPSGSGSTLVVFAGLVDGLVEISRAPL
jgi:RES domain-containing protein